MEMLGLDDQPRMSLKLLKKERELGERFSSLDIWDANTAKKHWFCSEVFRLVLFNLVIYLIKEKTSF